MKLRSLLPAALLLAITTVSWTLAAAPASSSPAAQALQHLNALSSLRAKPILATKNMVDRCVSIAKNEPTCAKVDLRTEQLSNEFKSFYSNTPTTPIEKTTQSWRDWWNGAGPATTVPDLPKITSDAVLSKPTDPAAPGFLCRWTGLSCPAIPVVPVQNTHTFLAEAAKTARTSLPDTPSTHIAWQTNQDIATAFDNVANQAQTSTSTCAVTDAASLQAVLKDSAQTANCIAATTHQEGLRNSFLTEALKSKSVDAGSKQEIYRIYRAADYTFGTQAQFNAASQALGKPITFSPQPNLPLTTLDGLGIFLATPEAHSAGTAYAITAGLVLAGMTFAHAIKYVAQWYTYRKDKATRNAARPAPAAAPTAAPVVGAIAAAQAAANRAASAAVNAAAAGAPGGGGAGVGGALAPGLAVADAAGIAADNAANAGALAALTADATERANIRARRQALTAARDGRWSWYASLGGGALGAAAAFTYYHTPMIASFLASRLLFS